MAPRRTDYSPKLAQHQQRTDQQCETRTYTTQQCTHTMGRVSSIVETPLAPGHTHTAPTSLVMKRAIHTLGHGGECVHAFSVLCFPTLTSLLSHSSRMPRCCLAASSRQSHCPCLMASASCLTTLHTNTQLTRGFGLQRTASSANMQCGLRTYPTLNHLSSSGGQVAFQRFSSPLLT